MCAAQHLVDEEMRNRKLALHIHEKAISIVKNRNQGGTVFKSKVVGPTGEVKSAQAGFVSQGDGKIGATAPLISPTPVNEVGGHEPSSRKRKDGPDTEEGESAPKKTRYQRQQEKKLDNTRAGHFSVGRAKAHHSGIGVPNGDETTCIPDAVAALLGLPVGAVRTALKTEDGKYPSYGALNKFLAQHGCTLLKRRELNSNELALFNQTEGRFLLDLKIHLVLEDGTKKVDDHCVAFHASCTMVKDLRCKNLRVARGCLVDNQEEKPWFVEESDRADQQSARKVFTEGLYGEEREVRQVRMPRVYEIVSM